ncbi:putative heavy metal-associated domain, HMA [Medicago truncatula]|uniref:Putative heavy metal-associated domain, HMA n=1 Tax=Medicago truncatula TaxID=3880 RepID=A0A396HWR4_MEDTR|nr:heavy metal-associated isoprenylated plant protein 28 [Medicago truncatula]RHN56404.1 putative heavy metal-associated domain, HMA [Medicago truncatula]
MANMQIVPAYKNNVEAQYVEMMVPLYSYGCEKKIKKSLSSLKGIYSVNVDHCQQKVTVWGICNKFDVLQTVRSKRKDACFWNQQDNVELEEISKQPSSSPISLPTFPHKNFKRSLSLTKVRSLSLKAWKKVFTRSYSF